MIIEEESEYMFYVHERNKVEGEGIREETSYCREKGFKGIRGQS